MSDRNTIVLVGEIERRYDEGRVAAALVGKILPGYLIEQNADGEFQPHSDGSAVPPGETIVAVEDDFRGMTVEGTLPSDGVVAGGVGVGYVAGDVLRFHRAQKGNVLQMVLAGEQVVTMDDFLCSNGDGTLRVAVLGTDTPMFKATEDLDLTGEPDTFIRVIAL